MNTLRKVLVVDDDAVVHKSFDRVLRGKGYAVITADSGEEALEKLDQENYDLVFTDIKMPGMSGLEVVEEVKRNQPWLPVVVITGYGSEENEARADAAGVSGFLRKPLSPEMIESSATQALEEVAEPKPEPVAEQTATATEEVAATIAEEQYEPPKENWLKNVALFFAAPFIGLAYFISLPLVGMAMLLWLGMRPFAKWLKAAQERAKDKELARHNEPRQASITKRVTLFFAAPFIGLAYFIGLPIIGSVMIVWMALNAFFEPMFSDE